MIQSFREFLNENLNEATTDEILDIVSSAYDKATSSLNPRAPEMTIIRTTVENIGDQLNDYSQTDIKKAIKATHEKMYKKILNYF